ncbi:hypothetical protein CRG98_029940 [Punica granatum]|uniref:Uncharacterized protein n=1 Tax=Punica granatum TaxID=22663 RepID=A0A2I0J0D9_PUNGR|nr:hypothetical protein CRG98_029940 [Punica granatum]
MVVVVQEETSDSVSEEESEASPDESKDSWETEDSYLQVKMMGRGDGVDSDDARSEMVDPPQAAAPAAPTKGNLVFTLYDIPYSKWPDRLQEFLAYLTTRALTIHDKNKLMSDFVSRFTETLRNWWTGLTDQEQVQFIEIHVALEDACMKKQAFKEVLKGDKSMEKACKRPELYIKCSRKDKDCHFAKNCPKAKKQGARLVLQQENATWISLEKDDVESFFSLDEEAGPSSIATLEVLTDSDSGFSGSDSDTCYMAAEETERINLVNSVPHFPISFYISKYAKPIKVIAFLDTGTTQTIMNPKVLLKECWKPHTKHFSTASSEVFFTHLISRPLKILFFPGCYLITRVLGSALPRKDIFVGWDVITKFNKLRMMPKEVRFKHYFQPYVQTPRLFMAQEDEVKQILSELVQELKQHSCANSHSEFLEKCPHQLWKNVQFFVKLPFKKNEDINPTKARHSGMNHEHQKLATVECTKLLPQDLIEPSDAPWACETFYVNKWSEQIRGKLRLVINYQPLNHFLLDDKFPLPNKPALFSSLSKTKVFSKFDLKVGFWQLGIHPEDRPKTGFYIPNPIISGRSCLLGSRQLRRFFRKKKPISFCFDDSQRLFKIVESCSLRRKWGGRFKSSKQHYHSTFKEIMAVMNGIKKFEFHLVGYKFLVEMDMSSFPKMLPFK